MFRFRVMSGYDDNEVVETVRQSSDRKDALKSAEEDKRLLSEIVHRRVWIEDDSDETVQTS